jgi:hypothetical protein
MAITEKTKRAIKISIFAFVCLYESIIPEPEKMATITPAVRSTMAANSLSQKRLPPERSQAQRSAELLQFSLS